MSRELERFLRGFAVPSSESYRETAWRPPVDVYQVRGGWLVKVDLAGVQPRDVELLISGQRLVVRGERRDLALAEDCQAYSMEISYNRFERAIELPCSLEHVEIRHEFRDGMLLVTIAFVGESR